MNPTVEEKPKRVYCIQLGPAKDGGDWPPVIRIHADTLCRNATRHFTFKRDGCEVGDVRGDIRAWWIEEVERR